MAKLFIGQRKVVNEIKRVGLENSVYFHLTQPIVETQIIEVPIEKIVHVEKEVPVYVDRIVEKPIECFIEKIIHVEKEVIKFVDKPVEIIKEVEKVVFVNHPIREIIKMTIPKWVFGVIGLESLIILTMLLMK